MMNGATAVLFSGCNRGESDARVPVAVTITLVAGGRRLHGAHETEITTLGSRRS